MAERHLLRQNGTETKACYFATSTMAVWRSKGPAFNAGPRRLMLWMQAKLKALRHWFKNVRKLPTGSTKSEDGSSSHLDKHARVFYLLA